MSGESKILHEWFAAGEARSEVVRFSTLDQADKINNYSSNRRY